MAYESNSFLFEAVPSLYKWRNWGPEGKLTHTSQVHTSQKQYQHENPEFLASNPSNEVARCSCSVWQSWCDLSLPSKEAPKAPAKEESMRALLSTPMVFIASLWPLVCDGEKEKMTSLDKRWLKARLHVWWWTGRPGVLWSMSSQRVGHNWATELNWTELTFTKHPDKITFD